MISSRKADISVVFVTDNGFAVPTIVAITSLQINRNADLMYDVYIVVDNADSTYLEQFKMLAEDGLRIIIIYALDLVMRIYHQHPKCGATHAAQLKFMLPSLIPSCDKVLYLDSDVLINKGVEELYSTDVDGVYAAVVRDTGILYSSRTFPNASHYFNSGMLLLNLKLLRQDNIQEKLLDMKKRYLDTRWMDQGIFNMVFRNKIKLMDIKYNYLYLNLQRAQHKFSMQQLNDLFNSNYEDLEDIKRAVIIMHFASKDKPWKFIDGLCSQEWFFYYKKSIIAESPIERVEFQSKTAKVDIPIKHYLQKVFNITKDKKHYVIYLFGLKIKLRTPENKIKIFKYSNILNAVIPKTVLNLDNNSDVDVILMRNNIKYDTAVIYSKKYDCLFLGAGLCGFDPHILSEEFTIFAHNDDVYRLLDMLGNIPYYYIPCFDLSIVCADIQSNKIIEIMDLKI